MENAEQNRLDEQNIESQNPKLQIVESKNQIDFFMGNYAVYKKSGSVVMEIIDGGVSRFYELTKEEFEQDEFRALANTIRKNPQQFSSRELV